MKYVRFEHAGIISYGLLEDSTVWRIEGSPFHAYQKTTNQYPLSAVTLLSPCLPTKGVCIGLNYRDHAEEMQEVVPETPVVFMKPSGCTTGPHTPILYPSLSNRVDYEGELAIVIGRTASKVAEDEASQYILGYTCANDVTARDLQPKDGQWTIAKGFDTFMPLGPIITDEVDPTNLKINCRLNGTVRQQSNTKNLIFDCFYLVSYLSQIMTLYPGDVILTGTPSGVGPMQVTDTVEVEIEGIGTLTNHVIASL